jgi:hypothetical protein
MSGWIARDAPDVVEYGAGPSGLVLTDSAEATERVRRELERFGLRISEVVPIDAGADRLVRQAASDFVIALPMRDSGRNLDLCLAELSAGAREGRFTAVVAAPPILTDTIFPFIPDQHVLHLVDPDSDQWTTALAGIGHARTARLHDVRKGQTPPRLQQISEEVGRLASMIANLSEQDLKSAPAEPQRESDLDAGGIRAIIRARRLRDQYFPSEIFADPAWDMLLDLMAARLERQRVAVSSLCIAAAVPATTALRWIKTLTDHGVFIRVADPQDGRRVFIELSESAALKLEAYFKNVQRLSPTLI